MRRPTQLTPSQILRALCAAVVTGIFFASFGLSFEGQLNPLLFLLGLAISSILYFFYFSRIPPWRRMLFFLIVVGVWFSAWGIYALSFPEQESVFYATGASASVEGRVDRVDEDAEFTRAVVTDLLVNGEQREDRLLLFLPPYSQVTYGDQIRFSCKLEAPKPFDGFAYDRYLASREIFALCFLRETPIIVRQGEGNAFQHTLENTRAFVLERIDRLYAEPHASLLAGLLLGEQRFRAVWEERFIATGTIHIVAASGYNVAVVTFLLFVVFTRLGFRRQHVFFALLFGILAYVFIAGLEAPVVRAGIMGALVLSAKFAGRKTSMTNILLLTVVGMLLVWPRMLRDDIGFQLSLLSTVALIYVAPRLEPKFRFLPESYGIREALVATLAATFVTLPLTIFSFGTLSFIGPVANLLVLPLAPYAMALGTLAIFVSFISFSAGLFASGPAWALLSLILWVVKMLATVPHGFLLL